jgi:tetratricopeptide (TPR) repeat protein
MRVLMGPDQAVTEPLLRFLTVERDGKTDELAVFSAAYRPVLSEPGRAWPELLSHLPEGWEPDLFLFSSPEYHPILDGLENADCLTAALLGDWNLGGTAIRAVGDLFDVLLSDRTGTELLKRAGFPNVLHTRPWGCNLQVHRRLPDVERDIDILMIGSFNHAVQWERARWIARVARLSRRYKVVVTTGIYGEDYVRMLNRAKIVFNRSVGGGINMRAYEATACGALLFNERESNEIRDVFADREECVLYGEDDLEILFDYYLAPENTAERERIAEAGWRRAQEHDVAVHSTQMLSLLEPLAFAHKAQAAERKPRAFTLAAPSEQRLRLIAHWIPTCNPSLFPMLEEHLKNLELPPHALTPLLAEQNDANQAEVDNLHAVLLGEWALKSPSPQRESRLAEAVYYAERALRCEPDYVTARCNLAQLHLMSQQADAGLQAMRAALELLLSPDLTAGALRGSFFPAGFNSAHTARERLWGELTPGTDAWRDALRDLLIGTLQSTLAEAAFVRADYLSVMRRLEKAIPKLPTSAEAYRGLGCALYALGRTEEAFRAFRAAIEQMPFLLVAWKELAQALLSAGRAVDAAALMDDLKSILDGCPALDPYRAEYDRLRETAHYHARQAA